MWNKTWQPLIDAGKLEVIGIVQEQHAERTKLYKQWRQYKWPIVQDALNLLNVKVVPLLIAVDEKGTVVSHNANDKFINRWLTDDFAVEREDSKSEQADLDLAECRDQFLWQGEEGLEKAIAGYEKLLAGDHAKNKKTHFEIAVAYRNRFERNGDADDFQKAIDHWSTALALDPSQYIYRRRIEQYGARLGKPYPFYDWVKTANAEVRKRGEEPVPLKVPITGAEIASPVRKYTATGKSVDMATASKLETLADGMVEVSTVVVPHSVRAGRATRVHVLLTPKGVKWNNSGDKALVLLEDPQGGTLAKQQLQFPLPDIEQSTETRRFEFEVQVEKGRSEPVVVKGVALFGVCLDDSGICTYTKRPFEVTIDITK